MFIKIGDTYTNAALIANITIISAQAVSIQLVDGATRNLSFDHPSKLQDFLKQLG